MTWTHARSAAAGLLLAATLGAAAGPSHSSQQAEITVYKSRLCGCCNGWVEHMRARGFQVTVVESSTPERLRIQERYGVPYTLNSCHTSVTGKYIVQGHVPAEYVQRLLADQPDIAGIAVAGMPAGSPGMESDDPRPFDVVAVGKDTTWVYARHEPRR